MVTARIRAQSALVFHFEHNDLHAYAFTVAVLLSRSQFAPLGCANARTYPFGSRLYATESPQSLGDIGLSTLAPANNARS